MTCIYGMCDEQGQCARCVMDEMRDECRHLGQLFKTSLRGFTRCGECNAVFSPQEMVREGAWPVLPADQKQYEKELLARALHPAGSAINPREKS